MNQREKQRQNEKEKKKHSTGQGIHDNFVPGIGKPTHSTSFGLLLLLEFGDSGNHSPTEEQKNPMVDD